MTLVGYPDFQEQAQWQSPPAVEYSAAIANGATKSFPDTGPVYFNVSNWNATQLRIGGAQRLDVECVWYDAIPATAFLARSYFTTAPNNGSVVSLPNAGPYLQVNVSNLSGVGDTLTAVMAFTNRRQQPFIVPTNGAILDVEAQSVNAGAIINRDSAYTYAGPASVFTFTTATVWNINLHAMASDGTDQFFNSFRSVEAAGGPVRRAFIDIPPRPIRVEMFNGDGAAQQFWVVIVADVFR